MSDPQPITFVVAVNNKEILNRNLLLSPCLRQLNGHELLIQEHFDSAAKAYNAAIDKSTNDLMVFCHQDVFFPQSWVAQLNHALEILDIQDPHWGVLGCSGITCDCRMHGHVYSSGLGIVGRPSEPAQIQTLDEIVLILRKSSSLRFDESLPYFHFYGTDICLRAALRGMKSYAVSAFCIHNTECNFTLPKEFYECCKYIRRTWRDFLPIQTTCIRITSSNLYIYLRKLREIYFRYIRPRDFGGARNQDVNQLLQSISGAI